MTLLCLPMETGNLTELNDKSLHLYLKWFSMWSFWNFSYADQDRCTWHNPDIGISETVFWEWVDTIRPLTVDPQLMSSSVQCDLLHKQNTNMHQSAINRMMSWPDSSCSAVSKYYCPALLILANKNLSWVKGKVDLFWFHLFS